MKAGRVPGFGAIAIIPARGGSKGVLRKNLRRVGGVPLIQRAVKSCIEAKNISAVYVSTDDDEIAACARAVGALIIARPVQIATDIASSEDALIHVLNELDTTESLAPVVVFVQCTSPFIQSADIDSAIEKLTSENADTVLSVAQTHRFLWTEENGSLVGVNHDGVSRQRRQDLKPEFLETGAFYALRTEKFRSRRSRFMDKTLGQPVPEWTTIEIDTESDLDLANAICHRRVTYIEIAALITDFDGVHTDDKVNIDDEGHESVRVSRSDGYGIGALRDLGLPMLILSKERNPVVTMRAKKLRIDAIQCIDNKLPEMMNWLKVNGISPADTAYVGNDVNDLECMKSVGWPIAVSDAHPKVQLAARIVLERKGGEGALREVADRTKIKKRESL